MCGGGCNGLRESAGDCLFRYMFWVALRWRDGGMTIFFWGCRRRVCCKKEIEWESKRSKHGAQDSGMCGGGYFIRQECQNGASSFAFRQRLWRYGVFVNRTYVGGFGLIAGNKSLYEDIGRWAVSPRTLQPHCSAMVTRRLFVFDEQP